MSAFTKTSAITITCHKRITPYLEQEIKDLGFGIEDRFVTGVRLSGTINDCIKLNLNLRCASQVLYSLKQFKAADADAVYRNICKPLVGCKIYKGFPIVFVHSSAISTEPEISGFILCDA